MKYEYKKLFAMAVLLFNVSVAYSQENRSYARLNVGSPVSGKWFNDVHVAALHGIDLSLEVGHDFHGLEASIAFDYYDYQASTDFDNKISDVMLFSAMAFVNYDVLRFIKGNWRHHIRPCLGLGYSKSSASNLNVSHDMGTKIRSSHAVDSGFEWVLGIGYDFSITNDWSVGVNYEKFMHIRDLHLLSLRAGYTF